MEEFINSIGLPLIAVGVPIVVAAFKKMLPSMPKWIIPILAAVIGPASALALSAIGAIHADGWVVALLGVAGVGIREITTQITGLLSNKQ